MTAGIPELFAVHAGHQGAHGDLTLEVELPPLQGTAHQVPWAEDLRRQAITGALHKLVESPDATRAFFADPLRHRLLHSLASTAARLTDAQWWIDRRGSAGLDLLGEAIRHVRAHTAAEHRDYLQRRVRRLKARGGSAAELRDLEAALSTLDAHTAGHEEP